MGYSDEEIQYNKLWAISLSFETAQELQQSLMQVFNQNPIQQGDSKKCEPDSAE